MAAAPQEGPAARGGLPRAAAAAPDIAPLCPGVRGRAERPQPGKGGGLCPPAAPLLRPGGYGTAPAARQPPANLGPQPPKTTTTKNNRQRQKKKPKCPGERRKQANGEHDLQEEDELFAGVKGASVPCLKLGGQSTLLHKITCIKAIIFSVFIYTGDSKSSHLGTLSLS